LKLALVIKSVFSRIVNIRIFMINLSLVLCGCKLWSFALGEDINYTCLKRKVFRTISDCVNEQFRTLHNEELRVKCRSPSTVRIVKSRRLSGLGM
jgi:hypothetical protein